MITKIMVAEDNTIDYLCYQNYFSNDKTINFVGHAKDGETAINMYNETNPDLIFLDLGLPKKNGLEVLENISKQKSKCQCNVIIVSGDSNLKGLLSDTQKVYRIIHKPVDTDQIKNAVYDFRKDQRYYMFPTKKCNTLLMHLNINPYTKTGKILTSIIHHCYQDIDLLDNNMEAIYLIISREFCCPVKNVQSSLRSSINTINRYSNDELLNEIFYLKNKKNITMSPKKFISGFVTYLNNITE